MMKMIESDQRELIKCCLKYHAEYDIIIKNSRILLSGAHLEQSLSSKILLSDFFNLMLEKDYPHDDICQQLIFLKHYVNYRELFVLFAVRRKVRLMSFLINSPDLNFQFKPHLIIDILANDVYDIAMLLYREYFLKLSDKNYGKIIKYITTAFMKTGQTEEKCYLYVRLIDRVTLEEAIKFINIISLRVFSKSKSNIFLVCLNIVKIGCLLVQLVEKLASIHPVLKNRVFEIRTEIVRILKTYMEDVSTMEEMRFLLLSKDLDYRDALTYISEYEILDLLKIPLAAEIANEIWDSRYNIRGTPLVVSSNHNLLFNYNHTRYDQEGRTRFYIPRDVKSFGCHAFQFQVWRNSGKSRYYAEIISLTACIILAHTWVISYLALGRDLTNYVTLQRNAIDKTSYQANIDDTGLSLYLTAMKLTYIGFVFCQLALQNMFRSIYTGYIKQQMTFYTIENFIDICIFTLFLNYIVITYRIDLEGTWFIQYSRNEKRDIFVNNFINKGVDEELAITLCGVSLWVRLFFTLRLTPFIGPIVMMFYSILKELFGDLSNFKPLASSLKSVFETSWGSFDFTIANNGRFGNLTGYIFLVFVVIAVIIILINFLIALFASKYTDLMKNMKAIMMNEALKIRHVTEADEMHSSLISGAFPLSGLNWITPAFMFCPRSPKIANEVILHIQYVPIMLIVTSLFIVYSLIIWPITYLKLIPHKFALIFKKNVIFSGNGANRFGSFCLLFFFGLIILFCNLCVDVYYFVVHLYSYDLERVDDEIKNVPDMSMRTYNKLYAYLESYHSPYMGYEKVANEIRDQLDVLLSIKQMLFPHQAILKGKYQRNPQKIVNEYIIIIKKILLNNSITVQITRLFPGNVKKQYKEIRFNKRILQYCLLDLLRFRKLLLLKGRFFLFTLMYSGLNSSTDILAYKKKKQTERTIADAFNYLNTKRTLMAIGYKPKEKIVSHEDVYRIEEASDTDLGETMRDFQPMFDKKIMKKGGLLSRNTSKISFKKTYTMKRDNDHKLEKSNTMGPNEMDIAMDFRLNTFPEHHEIEKELARALEEESITPIPGLGDSDDSEDLFPSRAKKNVVNVNSNPANNKKKDKSNESYNIPDSDDDYSEESESEEDEIEDVNENVEFTRDGGIINPKIN